MRALASSLRARKPVDTLAFARPAARALGVTRVTDTTWLDRIGVPVYASIRPTAQVGSLCVHAGKGLVPIDAEVGAYMEAIEFAVAEPRERPCIESRWLTPRTVGDAGGDDYRFVDFCLRFKAPVNPDDSLRCVSAEDVVTGARHFVPAELVFLPAPEEVGQRLFGSTSNGLASGNTVLEATVHAIAELIERDVQSFNYIRNTSVLVHTTDCPASIRSLLEKIERADLLVALRYLPNVFAIPCFEAFIMEKSLGAPISVALGAGCHPVKSVAAIRAITEAAQSRLSHIHGGRDDIIDRVKHFERAGNEAEMRALTRLRRGALDAEHAVPYSQIGDHVGSIACLEDAMDVLTDALQHIGARRILRVRLTEASEPLQVVKVVVPKLEAYNATLMRVGPRLAEYVRDYC